MINSIELCVRPWHRNGFVFFIYAALCIFSKISKTTSTISLTSVGSAALQNLPETNVQTELEPINGTLNYRINGKKGKDIKPWVVDLDMRQCVRRGRCLAFDKRYNTCLGSKIPYEFTSLDLTDYRSQKELTEALEGYRALRHVPKCWAVIQPFLCAVFKPKCEEINDQDMVYLPSLEMCRITLEPCRILYNTTYFPQFLRCNDTLFPPKCNNDVREMKFNITGSCMKPLVPAESQSSYYPGIDGCGVQCKDPLYTDDEHRQIEKLIAWAGTLCMLANLFVVATFCIDWENASKYPALIVFYINFCFLIACLGWLLQFTPGSREDIVCKKDGTLRQSEPTAGENLSCTVIFVLVYYFLMAAMVWFVFLTYAWHLRAVGNVQGRIDKKGSYFHLVAWSLPLVLTITTMALSEVDGNSTVGICFVGYLNHSIRAGLLLGPLCGVILVGGYFIMRGMIMLFGLKHFANDIKSISASNKIHLIIVRMGFCALLTFVFILVAIACHVTEFRHAAGWAESLRQFIICQILNSNLEQAMYTERKCKIENRPSVAILQLHLLCLFGAGIVMSSWCWTPSSIETWKRYIKKKCGKEVVEEIKMPKHKVIAQTWAKRKEFEDKGRLSITLYNTHTDPVGLNFDVNDLNSSETNEISSTWANYLPQFVKRRMAITGAGTTNSSSQGPRKNSLDSEISFSVRHVSVESRRNSVDSQVSVKIAEMKTKVAARTRAGHHKQSAATANSKRSQRRRDFIASSHGRKYSGRRESSTSIESQIISLKKTTYPNASHKVGLFSHQSTKKYSSGNASTTAAKSMKRRSANAGLYPADINKFLTQNGQFILPFLQNQGMTTTSDEDEISRASFKVQDSRLDVVLKQDLSDDDDDDDDDDDEGEEDVIFDNDDVDIVSKTQMEELRDSHEREKQRIAKKQQQQLALKNLLKSSTKSQRQEQQDTFEDELFLRKFHDLNLTKSQRYKQHNTTTASATAHSKTGHNNNNKMAQTKRNDDADGDSIGNSSAELDIALGSMLHSSYSGISNGKPHSRNSKTSCDVGIQANAYEIATQTLATTYDDDDDDEINEANNIKLAMRQLNAKNRHKCSDAVEATEMHALLAHTNNVNSNCNNNNNGSSRTKETMLMSESEKLKMLLLP